MSAAQEPSGSRMEDVGSLSSSLLLSGPTRAVEARLEDLLNRAQQAVKAIHASMSSAAGEGPPLLSSKEVEALAAEGAKALKEMDAAVQVLSTLSNEPIHMATLWTWKVS